MAAWVIILTILHSYVFAIMFFAKRKLSSTFLGLYMLSFFVQGTLMANFYYFHIDWLYKIFYLFISAITVLYFPLIYLYVKVMVEDGFKLAVKHLFHFAPAIIFLTLQLITYFNLDPETKQLLYLDREIIATNPALQPFFSLYVFTLSLLLIQIIGYSIAMVIKLLKHRKNIEKEYSYKHKITLNWLFVFVLIYIAYYALEIIIFSFDGIEVSEEVYFSIISIHIFFVGIWGLRQKDIYKNLDYNSSKYNIDKQTTREIEEISNEVENQIINKGKEKADKRDLLEPGLKNELAEKIELLITEEKLFLNPEFSLGELSDLLKIHKNYVSFVINDVFDKNFYKYVNELRIEEAKRMLIDPNNDHLSIEGIAQSCGYKSRNVFYPIFKKLTGLTPTQYKEKFYNSLNE